jgi:hypothetical protein
MHRAFKAYFQSLPPLHKPEPKPTRPGLLTKPSPNEQKDTEEVVPKITLAHLKKMAELVDEKFSEYELAEMVLEADKDGDGEISEQDFLRIMKRTVRFFCGIMGGGYGGSLKMTRYPKGALVKR